MILSLLNVVVNEIFRVHSSNKSQLYCKSAAAWSLLKRFCFADSVKFDLAEVQDDPSYTEFTPFEHPLPGKVEGTAHLIK